MPGIIAASSSEPSSRRILQEKISSLESHGFELIRSQDGGDWQSLFSAATTAGLFSPRGYVRVESAEDLGVFPNKLGSMVEAAESASSLFILIYSGDYKKYFPKELYPLIGTIDIPKVPKWRDKRYEWLKAQVRDKGCSIDDDAAVFLIDTIDEPEEILSEVSKLALAAGNGPIDIQMVKDLTLDEGKNALLELMDGICLDNPEKVIRAIEVLKRKSEVIPVIAALYNRVRIGALSYSFRKCDSWKVQKKLNFRNYQLKLAKELFRHHEAKNIFEFVLELIKVDYAEKSNDAKGWPAIEFCILNFMAEDSDKKREENFVDILPPPSEY